MITALKFLAFFTILLDLITILKIFKDNQYLLDKQKTKLYIITLVIPIFGAFYALKKVGFKFLNFIYPISKATNSKVSRCNTDIFEKDIAESKLEIFEDITN